MTDLAPWRIEVPLRKWKGQTRPESPEILGVHAHAVVAGIASADDEDFSPGRRSVARGGEVGSK